MIQPLKAPKSHWFLYWIDLSEPVPLGEDWMLPTLVIVCDQTGTPVAPPELMEELDQARVENFLYKIFDGTPQPDRLSVSASDDWDQEAWQTFSADCKIDIRFQSAGSESVEELQSLTKTLVMRVGRESGGPGLAREVAAGLVRTALRLRSTTKRVAMLRLALEKDVDCALARIELADWEFQSGNWKSCLGAYEEVIAREAPKWLGGRSIWWIDQATRPYLRAIYGKAMTQWHLGRYTSSARTLEELLTLNPVDNQGARFLVPMLHLLAESPERAMVAFSQYAERYPNDYSEPSFVFGWALCYSLEGLEQEARAKYTEGCLKNIYMAPMLLEQPEPPKGLWMPNDRAEASYASDFIESYAVLWDREAGALRLLRELYTELQPRVAKIVEHRVLMSDFQDQRYEPDYKKTWQEMVLEDERLMLP